MSAGRFLRRALGVGAASVVAGAALVVFFAWLALQVRWEVPDPGALTGPSTVLARDGTLLGRFASEVDRRIVPLDAVAPVAIDAVIAHEDARFYEHEGVDPFALLRAVVTNVRTGSISQGGSTLTQQYVKNAFTDRERTLTRKVREAVISIQLERELTKDEILHRYLNTVYFGEGAYGIEAAALTYFGVPAAQLSPLQAAALAQSLPAPSVRNPRADPAGAEARADALLQRMVGLELLPATTAAEQAAAPLEVRPRERATTLVPYFVQYVRGVLTAAFGEEAVLTGGLEVRTTIDLAAQQALERAVKENLPTLTTGFEAGAVAVDPASGDITAMYGGWDFYGRTANYSPTEYAQVNLATQGHRQPGSTFKPFVLLAALEEGMSPDRRYPAPAALDVGGPEPVRNADGRGYGTLQLDDALVGSVNTVYARLGLDLGPAKVVDVAARLGVRSPLDAVPLIGIGGTARPPGSTEFVDGPTVLDMASAYATLANDGLACPARSVLEVLGPDGQPLPPPAERRPPEDLLESRPADLKSLDQGRCYQAVHPDIARTVNRILERAVDEGTGRRARIGRPQAGKTGTTDGFVDAWFVGYTPNLALAVWLGDPDEGQRSLLDVAGVSRVFGGTLPATIWREAAAEIVAGLPPLEFPEPGTFGRGQRRARAPMSRDPAPAATGTASPGASPEPTSSPSPGGSPSQEPTASPSASPSGSPSPTPTESDGDDGRCLPPVFTEGCDEVVP